MAFPKKKKIEETKYKTNKRYIMHTIHTMEIGPRWRRIQ